MTPLEMALHLHSIGINPVVLRGKIPTETGWQRTKLTEHDIKAKFGNGAGLGACCGTISGELENIDFDSQGEIYGAWVERVEAKAFGLINRLAVEQTPSGGFHVSYFCPEIRIPGNTKLAKKRVEVTGQGEHEYRGKTLKAVEEGSQWVIYPELIETRGNGGQVAIFPSVGYLVLQPGEAAPYKPPKITAAERNILIEAAKSFDESPTTVTSAIPSTYNNTGGRPGDEYNAQVSARQVYDLMTRHGWKKHSTEGNLVHLTRPGKEVLKGRSGTLYSTGVFHCFTENAHPFEQEKDYSPFAVYAVLEHNGDYNRAARELNRGGFGPKKELPTAARCQVTRGTTGGLSLATMQKHFRSEYQWVWGSHIPRGLPIMISGREGTGKTTIALQMAKEILEDHPEELVFWFATEGAVSDTYIKAMGLGLNKDRFLIAYKNESGRPGEEDFTFNFKYNVDRNRLNKMLSKAPAGVVAVFVDSIRGMTEQSVNDEETGNTMRKINAIVCDRHKAALVYLHHFNKKDTKSLLDKNTGSTTITSAVRLVLAVIPQSKYLRKLVVGGKNNLGVEIESLEVLKDRDTVEIYSPSDEVPTTQTQRAEEFLLGLLRARGKMPQKEIERLGKNKGLSLSLLKKVKRGLPVDSERGTDGWFWSIRLGKG